MFKNRNRKEELVEILMRDFDRQEADLTIIDLITESTPRKMEKTADIVKGIIEEVVELDAQDPDNKWSECDVAVY